MIQAPAAAELLPPDAGAMGGVSGDQRAEFYAHVLVGIELAIDQLGTPARREDQIIEHRGDIRDFGFGAVGRSVDSQINRVGPPPRDVTDSVSQLPGIRG